MKVNKWLLRSGWLTVKISIVLFVVKNFYFGWNSEPLSELETDAGIIIKTIMWFGWIVYFTPMLTIYEKKVKKLD